VHRRAALEVTRRQGIPVTTIVATLVDLAATSDRLEAAINEADKRDLIDPERLAKRWSTCRPARASRNSAKPSTDGPSR
jgi:hypothetical protein